MWKLNLITCAYEIFDFKQRFEDTEHENYSYITNASVATLSKVIEDIAISFRIFFKQTCSSFSISVVLPTLHSPIMKIEANSFRFESDELFKLFGVEISKILSHSAKRLLFSLWYYYCPAYIQIQKIVAWNRCFWKLTITSLHTSLETTLECFSIPSTFSKMSLTLHKYERRKSDLEIGSPFPL